MSCWSVNRAPWLLTGFLTKDACPAVGTWLGMQEVQRQGCSVGREIQTHAGQREGLEPGGRGPQSRLGGAGLALAGTPAGGHTG